MYMPRNAYTRPRNVKFAVAIPFSYDKIKPREAQKKAQGGGAMYIAVCDDQIEELEKLTALL